MSCEICGRGACTRSFHSLEDQDRFDARQEMPDDVGVLRELLQEAQEEIAALKRETE